jgi:hypothetical protein
MGLHLHALTPLPLAGNGALAATGLDSTPLHVAGFDPGLHLHDRLSCTRVDGDGDVAVLHDHWAKHKLLEAVIHTRPQGCHDDDRSVAVSHVIANKQLWFP